MKRVLLMLIAIVPLGIATVLLQSCAGQGGPNTSVTGTSSPTAAFLALLPTKQATASYVGASTCAQCHNMGANPIYTKWQQTKHGKNNVTCERCHGPGSVHVSNAQSGTPPTSQSELNPNTADILTYPKIADAVLCAQCHGTIYNDWKSTPHAELASEVIGGVVTSIPRFAATSPASLGQSSRCVACHSGILRAQIVDQGIDLGTLALGTAPDGDSTNSTPLPNIVQISNDTDKLVPASATCITCHDAMALTGNVSWDGDDHQLRHTNTESDEPTVLTHLGPGTTAATFTTFDSVCGECHNARGVDPLANIASTSASNRPPHAAVQFNMLTGISGWEPSAPAVRNMAHFDAQDQCAHCHLGSSGQHSFTPRFDGGCAPCHTASESAALATTVGNQVTSALFNLKFRMEQWATGAGYTATGWDYNTTSGGTNTNNNFSSIPTYIKQARYNWWFIIRDNSNGVHNHPYTNFLLQVANQALDANGVPPAPAVSKLSIQQQKADLDQFRAQVRLGG